MNHNQTVLLISVAIFIVTIVAILLVILFPMEACVVIILALGFIMAKAFYNSNQ